MSFANQYIQKYGQRAIEAYKRSLKHSDDQKVESPKKYEHEQTIKRSQSNKRSHSNHSKSSKSIHKKGKMRQNSSRSQFQHFISHPTKQKINNPTYLKLGLCNQQKKKLIISSINTPKNGTPNKNMLTGKNRTDSTKVPGMNTNVNVYLQAVQHSKSKQSTTNIDINLHNSRQKPTKSKKGKELQIIKDIMHICDQQQTKRQNKILKTIKQKLKKLQNYCLAKQKKVNKLQLKFENMRQVVIHNSLQQDTFVNDREKELQQKSRQLQKQLNKYKQKQKSLMRIIESLSYNQGHRWKQQSDQQQPNSSNQNDLHQ